MSLFKWKEYWRYRKVAKTRHGIHSPFVYKLIDEALRPAAHKFSQMPVYRSESGGTLQVDLLLRRLLTYFRFREILVLNEAGFVKERFFSKEHSAKENGGQELDRLFDGRLLTYDKWLETLNQRIPQISEGDVFLVVDIHSSDVHAKAWRVLCDQVEVHLSIDLFNYGLLFFSADFKERQHFVLKYPL